MSNPFSRRPRTYTARATADRHAVITLAEAIVKAEWERAFGDLERRLAEIRKETGR